MSVDEAIAAASAGDLALLAAPDASAEAVAAQCDARVVDAAALAMGAVLDLGGERVVVARAEMIAGVVPDSWVGAWDLEAWKANEQPAFVLLHTHCTDDAVPRWLGRRLELAVFGPFEDVPGQASDDVLGTEEVERALELAREQPLTDVEAEVADVLVTLAVAGHIRAAWRTPFGVRVADDRRFKRPFVEEDPEILRFFEAYQSFVDGLGMLEVTEYRFHGRQPKDLRRYCEALGWSMREMVAVFRRMDRRGIVVSAPVEEGAGERPNLELVLGEDVVDVEAAVQDVRDVLNARRRLALPPATPSARPVAEPQTKEEDVGAALFASLGDAPAVAPEETRPAPAPRPAPPPQERDPLPDHLPGLAELADGDLDAARSLLAAVAGELADQAMLLAAFRYDVIDLAGRAQRRYEIPGEIVQIAQRALQLEAVPPQRTRETLDAEFPGAFVEVPRQGLTEIYFEEGPLEGTHRLTELLGRRDFERGRLQGARAAQAALAAGQYVAESPGDPGWEALAEVLRLRDERDGEGAREALDRVDVDVDLDDLTRQVIELLPPDHPERAELDRRAEAERLRRILGPITEQMNRALEGRGREEQRGHEAMRQAEEADVLPRLVDFLEARQEVQPNDPGPSLWTARIHVKQGDLSRAEKAYRHAVKTVRAESRQAEWTFECAEIALRNGEIEMWWRQLKQLLKLEPNPRAVDSNLERLMREGLLKHAQHDDLRDLLDRRGGARQFPRTYRKIKTQDELDPWKKALLRLKLGE